MRFARRFEGLDTRAASEQRRTMPGNESEVPNIACRVRSRTPPAWLSAVRADLALFLQDHAACERKASATAMALASHYRDKKELVQAMIDVACEELDHFRRVYG